MTAKAREALFSLLGSNIVGADVLDLYAGSGSLGLEALSRGAAGAVFVERDRRTAAVLRANVDDLALGGRVVVADVDAYLAAARGCYDLVFVDPPYAVDPSALDATLAAITPRLQPGAILVVHRRFGDAAPSVDFPNDASVRRYGDTNLFVFRRMAQP